MRETKKLYDTWCASLAVAVAAGHEIAQTTTLLQELVADKDNEAGINDRFYCDLGFGTGGLRGVLGAGTNRMNIYTIAKATRGLAAYLNAQFEAPSCAIAYDSRNNSDVFAHLAAAVLAEAGVVVHLYPQLMPTPLLSYAVRALGCDGGIVITASHNPAKYNGYKVYGADGCQITLEAAEAISAQIAAQEVFAPLPSFGQSMANDNIHYISDELVDGYYQKVLALSVNRPSVPLQVVYSPLNGAGNLPVREILKRLGNVNVTVVKEQELPDGNFPTCSYPNPEEAAAMALAVKLAQEQGADFCLATDPDCDRVGVAVVKDGKATLINGNEMGVMLLEYMCKTRLADANATPIAVKTIVTTEMARKVAAHYGVDMIDVLTGFKFIGEQIGLLEAKGEQARFLLGFEESYGYLAGDFVRDKDAVIASMLICEMAAYYKAQGKSLLDVLAEAYETYGYYQNKLLSFEFAGQQGMAQMGAILEQVRNNQTGELYGQTICSTIDYQYDDTGLPKSNVIKLMLADESVLVIRPSGTEPKLKVYVTAVGETLAAAQQTVEALVQEINAFIKGLS